ncbi:unnamed protein product [Dicrocoelium dendriticum]|nr:unnamed protein product [Dicrocoelium dendriticum]
MLGRGRRGEARYEGGPRAGGWVRGAGGATQGGNEGGAEGGGGHSRSRGGGGVLIFGVYARGGGKVARGRAGLCPAAPRSRACAATARTVRRRLPLAGRHSRVRVCVQARTREMGRPRARDHLLAQYARGHPTMGQNLS